jgi:transcription elongation factor Elf1
MTSEVIICPVCGATMNHHANKLVYRVEASLDAMEELEKCYECPRCGTGVSRPVVWDEAP